MKPTSMLGSVALASSMLAHFATGSPICNAVSPKQWQIAKPSNPQLVNALDELSKYAIATWYTDRDNDNRIANLLSECADQVPAIVIYGLPGKDCAAGFSGGGSNQTPEQYKTWIQTLATQVGNHEVIYVLEPDAVGLLANNECGKQKGYLDNLKAALEIISSTNPNGKVYVDVAGWAKHDEAVKILNELKGAGKLTGIAINTSNYKANSELLAICESYSSATDGLHCVFDTSRNYRGSKGDEWCNGAWAGIGHPPGTDTGSPIVDYNLWLKVPGESDGSCDGQSADAMAGPNAGSFFPAGFISLWDKGYFVDKAGLPKIGEPWPNAPTPPETPQANPPPAQPTPIVATKPTPEPTPTPSPTATNSDDHYKDFNDEDYDEDEWECEDEDYEEENEGAYDEYSATPSPTTSIPTNINLQADSEGASPPSTSPVSIFLITAVVLVATVGVAIALFSKYRRHQRDYLHDQDKNNLMGMEIVTLGTPVEHHGLDTDRCNGVQVL